MLKNEIYFKKIPWKYLFFKCLQGALAGILTGLTFIGLSRLK